MIVRVSTFIQRSYPYNIQSQVSVDKLHVEETRAAHGICVNKTNWSCYSIRKTPSVVKFLLLKRQLIEANKTYKLRGYIRVIQLQIIPCDGMRIQEYWDEISSFDGLFRSHIEQLSTGPYLACLNALRKSFHIVTQAIQWLIRVNTIAGAELECQSVARVG